MLKKTITKNFPFVIFLIGFSIVFSGCFSTFSNQSANNKPAKKNDSTSYGKPEIVGKIKSGEITESSGIIVSKCQAGIFWTHNDSGDGAFIYALDFKGENLGTWKISGAKNTDWEDIAAFKNPNGECFLYLGDIGNNTLQQREFAVYRVREPQISGADKNSSRRNPLTTETADAIKFAYPNAPSDAETLLVHPQTGDIYILTKRLDGASEVYKMPKNYSLETMNRIEKIADFAVPAIPNGLLTGGDISSDGKRVIVCDYYAAYEIVLPETAKNFDEIWTEKPTLVELGKRDQGEAIGYSADNEAIYATSEGKNSPLIRVARK